jgi:hypothetical protein
MPIEPMPKPWESSFHAVNFPEGHDDCAPDAKNELYSKQRGHIKAFRESEIQVNSVFKYRTRQRIARTLQTGAFRDSNKPILNEQPLIVAGAIGSLRPPLHTPSLRMITPATSLADCIE